jgi:hypothetical protein
MSGDSRPPSSGIDAEDSGLTRPMPSQSRIRAGKWALLAAALSLAAAGCTSSEPDPRCTIDAEGRHEAKLATTLNKSKVWKLYFEEIDPQGSRPLVELSLKMERVRMRSRGGDYDPGKVNVLFSSRSLTRGSALYEHEVEVDLQPFMIGFFEEDASRDEIQEVAFDATEDQVYPFLATWVDLAGLRAMGLEGSSGQTFVPFLEALLEDKWTNLDTKREVRAALKSIQG